MENEKKKLDGGKIITTVIITVSTAIVFLALGYWAGTLQSEEAETATDTTALSSATTTVSSVASTSASATTSTTSTADWKTYTNTKYGFTLAFTDKWKGYEVVDFVKSGSGDAPAPATDKYTVYVPTSTASWPTDKKGYASIFTINIYPKAVYDAIEKDPSNADIIAEKNGYVFVYTTGQDFPGDIEQNGLVDEIKGVVKSITFSS